AAFRVVFLSFACTRRRAVTTLLPYPTLFRSLGTRRRERPASTGPGRGDRDELGRIPDDLRSVPSLQRGPVAGTGMSELQEVGGRDRKSTRLNSSHVKISYAVFCLNKTTSAIK